MYPQCLVKVIEYFKKLPGIGEKSAERIALGFLEMSEEDVSDLSSSIVNSKTVLKNCQICGHITDKDVCSICSDDTREKKLICVLEDSKSVFAFEKAGNFSGFYHVLGGLISPIDDVRPEDINLSSLVKRVDMIENCELIIALKSTIEGETTTLYINKIFETKPVVISRLSYGLPMGAEIDYLDSVTLDRAIKDRKNIS